jgi:regulatory protein
MEKAKRPLKTSSTNYALWLLGKRGHSRAELAGKLKQRGYEVEAVEAALKAVAAYLDDDAFALSRIRYRAVYSKWGRGRITQELAAKGVAEAVVNRAFAAWAESDENRVDWQAQATEILERKFGRYSGRLEQKDYAKRVNFLIRRGFDFSQAQAAVQALRIE